MKFMMKTKVVEVKNGDNGHIVVVEPASGGKQTEVCKNIVFIIILNIYLLFII